MNSTPPETPSLVRQLTWRQCLWRDPLRLVRMVVTLILTIWLAWFVGADDFGFFQGASAMALLLSTAAGLGIEAMVKDDLARRPAEAVAILGTSMALRAVAGGVGFLLLFLFAPSNPSLKPLWLVLGLFSVTQTPLVLAWWFETGPYRRVTRISQACSFAFTAIFLILLLWHGAATVWFAAAFVLEQPIYALLVFAAHLKIAPYEDTFTWDWAIARRWLKNARKPLGLSLLSLAILPLNQLLALWLTSPEECGRFGVAFRFYEFGWFAIIALLAAQQTPQSDDRAELSAGEAFERASKISWTVALLSLVAAIGVIELFLRAEYQSAVWATALLSLALIPTALGLVRDGRLQRAQHGNEVVRLQIAGALFNLPVAAVCIHFMGAIGAALATFASLLVTAMASTRFSAAARALAAPQWRAFSPAALWRDRPQTLLPLTPTGQSNKAPLQTEFGSEPPPREAAAGRTTPALPTPLPPMGDAHP